MTKSDKWLAGISFVALIITLGIIYFSLIYLTVTHRFGFIALILYMAIMVLITLKIGRYMRTWQDWADNVKAFIRHNA